MCSFYFGARYLPYIRCSFLIFVCLNSYISLLQSISKMIFFSGQSIDPCDTGGYSLLYRSGDRGSNCTLGYYDQICDNSIKEKWYRIQSHDDVQSRTMITEPPKFFECGTESPIWLNGMIYITK